MIESSLQSFWRYFLPTGEIDVSCLCNLDLYLGLDPYIDLGAYAAMSF